MSKIDKLGGYKNAKEAYEFLNSCRWHRTPEPDIDALGAELLTYRRANNIFEVGDGVVLLKNQHMWHNMGGIYTVTSTDIYDGITIGVAIEYKNTSHGNEIGNIRHATNEEIAAGYRGAK